MDRFTQFAFVAAREAIADAKLPDDEEFKARVGGVIGTGIGGIITFWLNSDKANENGTWSKVTPFFIPMLMANAAPAHISMAYGYHGPFFAAASACASGERRDLHRVQRHRLRRCDRDDHRRKRGDGLAAGDRRLLLDARDVDAQRRSDARQPSLRSRARRLRARRRRRHFGARGVRARACARRRDLLRAARLRPIRRRVRSGRARSGWKRRAARIRPRASRAPESRRTTWTTSTRTARRRRSAILPNRRRSRRRSASTPTRSASARRSRCTATRSARPAESRASRRRSRCYTN